MRYIVHESPKGPIAELAPEAEERLVEAGDFLDAMASSPAPTLALKVSDLPAEFLDLKSGLAGEVLQKVSNYRWRMVILGDFSEVPKKSLRDFIYESNATGQVVFAPDLGAAVALLR